MFMLFWNKDADIRCIILAEVTCVLLFSVLDNARGESTDAQCQERASRCGLVTNGEA